MRENILSGNVKENAKIILGSIPLPRSTPKVNGVCYGLRPILSPRLMEIHSVVLCNSADKPTNWQTNQHTMQCMDAFKCTGTCRPCRPPLYHNTRWESESDYIIWSNNSASFCRGVLGLERSRPYAGSPHLKSGQVRWADMCETSVNIMVSRHRACSRISAVNNEWTRPTNT